MNIKEIIEQIEELEDKKQEIADEIKFILLQAKQEGLNEKAIKKLVQAKKRGAEELEREEEACKAYQEYKEKLK